MIVLLFIWLSGCQIGLPVCLVVKSDVLFVCLYHELVLVFYSVQEKFVFNPFCRIESIFADVHLLFCDFPMNSLSLFYIRYKFVLNPFY